MKKRKFEFKDAETEKAAFSSMQAELIKSGGNYIVHRNKNDSGYFMLFSNI